MRRIVCMTSVESWGITSRHFSGAGSRASIATIRLRGADRSVITYKVGPSDAITRYPAILSAIMGMTGFVIAGADPVPRSSRCMRLRTHANGPQEAPDPSEMIRYLPPDAYEISSTDSTFPDGV